MIFTQHGHRNIDLDGGVLAEWWTPEGSIHYGSEQWKLLPELDFGPKDINIFEKRRYDAFHGTVLQDILHQCKVSDCDSFLAFQIIESYTRYSFNVTHYR